MQGNGFWIKWDLVNSLVKRFPLTPLHIFLFVSIVFCCLRASLALHNIIQMSLIAFSTLFKLFLFKVRSNYIAHIQLIYCVKLSHLLWCLNSRVIKNSSSLLSEDADPQAYAEGCIKARALKASLRCCTHWLSWAVQVTVVWHSNTRDPEVLVIAFQIWCHYRYLHCRYHHDFCWNSFTSQRPKWLSQSPWHFTF